MFGYIDIHNHSVYGVDDGSKNMEQTMNMMRIAYEEGIRQIILTPHYKEDRFTKSTDFVRDKIEIIRECLKEEGLDLILHQGNELFYYCDCIEGIENKQFTTLAGSKYILVEFYPSIDYHSIRDSLANIINYGYLPILAHVERYDCLRRDYKLVGELIDMGIYTQINSSAVCGNHGREVKRFLKKILKKRWVYFVATDAHSDGTRSPRMKECSQYLTKKFGDEYTNELLFINPMKVITKEYI